MDFNYNNYIESKIRSVVDKNNNKETCGLVIKKDNLIEIFPCKNIADRQRHFVNLDPKDYLKASLNGDILAFYHTHTGKNNDFSCFDRINAANHKINFILYDVGTDSFKYLNEQTFKYENGPFEFKKNDCYTLVKKYYKNELNINLPNNAYDNDFELLAKQNNFIKIKDDEVQKHDVIIFNFYRTKNPPHLAVYLGNGFIFHIPRNGYPQINSLTEVLLKKIVCVLRYKGVENND